MVLFGSSTGAKIEILDWQYFVHILWLSIKYINKVITLDYRSYYNFRV